MSILNPSEPRNAMAGVVKIGYLKKNKSMRKKFFVLREETANNGPARLEYYDNEKKWRNNALPKNVTVLKTCFKIDKHVDSRTKRISIRLYTSEKFFYILFDSEQELDEWLDLMLVLQRATKEFGPGDSAKEPFEHIWHISILKKDLGMNPKLMDMTGICLYDKKVTIMKYPTKSKKQDTIDIMLSSIRCCGALGTLFYLEVGQSSPLGVGRIWINTWCSKIAKSVYDSVMGAFAPNQNYDPRLKIRSSSLNEHSSFRVREPCDIMPLRPRTISENTPSSTCSFHGILPSKQTFHKGCNCVSAHLPTTAFYNSGLTRSTDTNDGLSSFCKRRDQQPATLEERQDFVSFTPLNREEDLLRQTSIDSNTSSNNFNGFRSSASSQTCSCCDLNSLYGLPTSVDDHGSAQPNTSETSLPPDGYLPMKPSYTFCNYMSMGVQKNSKPDSIYMPQTESTLSPDYVPMAPMVHRSKFSGYVPKDCKQKSMESRTPTNSRFCGIHLEKVCAYLTPSEDKEPIIRPSRAYSVGSRPDGLREKIEKIYADRSRRRAFTVGSRGRLPSSGLSRPGYQSGSTSMSDKSDCGDHVKIDYSCNSKTRHLYSETCRTLSDQTPSDLSPKSSPKFCPFPDVSYPHKSSGRSPKSIVSSSDVKRVLAIHGTSRSPSATAHSYLSATLERVSEIPSVKVNDNYTAMKPGQGLSHSENTNMAIKDSNKTNYVNVLEATSSTYPIMKTIGNLSSKTQKKRIATPVQEQPVATTNEGIDIGCSSRWSGGSGV